MASSYGQGNGPTDKPKVLRPRQLDWKAAATFLAADPGWRRKVWIGGLLLLFPPLGWPVALGYRKTLIGRLNERAHPLLPEWRGNVLRYWLEGMKAVGVMTGYFAPVYALLLAKFLTVGLPELPWGGLLAFFGLAFFLSPFLGPVLVVLSSHLVGAATFSPGETAAVLGYFAVATAILPAGFLQVSRHGSYWRAFDLPAALRLIRHAPAEYAEAWVYSGLTSLLGHACLPLAPWGVFWCYQSIIYSFNEVRLFTGQPEDAPLAQSVSWFRACPGDPRPAEFWAGANWRAKGLAEACTPNGGNGLEPQADAFRTLRLGAVRAPLPRALERWLPL